MHSGLLPETIKTRYSWAISAMNEYASRKVLEYQQNQPDTSKTIKEKDEMIYKQSCTIVDLKKAINESIPASAELMQQISDSKDNKISQLQKRISELEEEIKALHNQDR